ncbi:hypothetical protein SeMB42_g05584 [Synchytrium endobioticum]|uniref:beta-glucosidase n=1 Tax=Synchytrium endobioticum TaxID=286115 RepID=A0A507D612_9FUNG|nr:hypothetical protein SeMB42_g05584 [Synchytrium endobioticum]TPX47019.1 hypothetical protein SeLEV6574_g02872 [Synchytrium endobioticum]
MLVPWTFIALVGALLGAAKASGPAADAQAGPLPAIPGANSSIPSHIWGFAGSAFQSEGSVSADGRAPSVWDKWSHNSSVCCQGGLNADTAADGYKRYAEDIAIMKRLGAQAYRFSVSWSRIYPQGTGAVNQAGLAFYNNLVNAVIAAGMIPIGTLYHWDLPQALFDKYGGWTNAQIINDFNAYADTIFNALGDRVKLWLTMNEPYSECYQGYNGGKWPPGITNNISAQLVCDHNHILAHATAVNTYKTKYHSQGGRISWVYVCDWNEPLNATSPADQAASQAALEFEIARYADPIYTGDYPASMRSTYGDQLPAFTAQQKALVLGSADFFGLNVYTAYYVQACSGSLYCRVNGPPGANTITNDAGFVIGGVQTGTSWFFYAPMAMRRNINWIHKRYACPIFVTENGFSMYGEAGMTTEQAVNDTARVQFFKDYLYQLDLAITQDKIDVMGYLAWSIVDNFEWTSAYSERFGVVHIDYPSFPATMGGVAGVGNGTLTRTPKQSATFLSTYFANYTWGS